MSDPRDERIRQLEQRVQHLEEQLAVALAALGEVAALRKENEGLKEKLRASSQNSSKPPSSDPPTITREPKKPTGRKPGGQPGHKRHRRELFPPEKVRNVSECKPTHCHDCQRRLHGADPNPRRHQVADLPKVEPIVDEYRLHTLTCSCGATTSGELPKGVPPGAFGPRVVATITTLLGVYGLSRRDVAELLGDAFGFPISVGGVVGCQKIGASSLAAAHAEAQAEVPKAPVKNADETGWQVGNLYACLWTVVTPTVTLFRIQTERSRDAARNVLGKPHGLLGSDRYSVYDHWPKRFRQFCWAHLARLFVRFSERSDPKAARLGVALTLAKDEIFALWHRVRDGTLARSTFQRRMAPMRQRIFDLLDDGARVSRCDKTRRTCERLLKHFRSLWTFVAHDGIEPTNNVAEQAIRRAVILRKTSFGSQSDHGCRFLERVLTVHATLRKRGAIVHDFIVAACRAHMLGSRGPSLLGARARPAP